MWQKVTQEGAVDTILIGHHFGGCGYYELAFTDGGL
jgi:hypothetical protein